jgi:hypothetical protein
MHERAHKTASKGVRLIAEVPEAPRQGTNVADARWPMVVLLQQSSTAAPHVHTPTRPDRCAPGMLRLDARKPQALPAYASQASNPSFDSTLDSDHLSASVTKPSFLLRAPGQSVTQNPHSGCVGPPCWRIYVAQPPIVAYGGDGHHLLSLVLAERPGAGSDYPHHH